MNLYKVNYEAFQKIKESINTLNEKATFLETLKRIIL